MPRQPQLHTTTALAKLTHTLRAYYISCPTSLLLLILLNYASPVSGIGCFVCYSADGSDALCADPFNTSSIVYSNRTSKYYQSPCWGYRKDRQGYFPADHCIKIEGSRIETDETTSEEVTRHVIIRTCALDSGSLTADTEIVRISHCGKFNYEGADWDGCVQSCAKDGCNAALLTRPTHTLVVLSVVAASYHYLL